MGLSPVVSFPSRSPSLRRLIWGADTVLVLAMIPTGARLFSVHPSAVAMARICRRAIRHVACLAQTFFGSLSQEILEKKCISCIASVDCLGARNQSYDEVQGDVDHHLQLDRGGKAALNLAAFSED